MLKTATSRGAQRRMRGPLPQGLPKRTKALRASDKARAHTGRNPSAATAFPAAAHETAPACVCPARMRPAQFSGRSCTAAGSCTRPSRKAGPGCWPLSGNRRFAVAGVSYFMVERPRMSTFLSAYFNARRLVLQKGKPCAANQLRRLPRCAQNIVVARDGKFSIPGAQAAQKCCNTHPPWQTVRGGRQNRP